MTMWQFLKTTQPLMLIGGLSLLVVGAFMNSVADGEFGRVVSCFTVFFGGFAVNAAVLVPHMMAMSRIITMLNDEIDARDEDDRKLNNILQFPVNDERSQRLH